MINIILDNLPWFWLVMAILFTVIEFCLPGLTTIWFAIGSVLLIPLSLLPIPFSVQIFICLVISTVLLIFTRPFALKRLNANKEKTNVDNVIGKTAVVIKKITEFDKGEVKADGIIWTAKTNDGSTLEENSECIITQINGVTAIVTKKTEA